MRASEARAGQVLRDTQTGRLADVLAVDVFGRAELSWKPPTPGAFGYRDVLDSLSPWWRWLEVQS